MSGYSHFAHYYDLLTDNVDYPAYINYIDDALRTNDIRGTVLDAGCGTGTMLAALIERGYDVMGVDADEEMLSVASEKCPGALLLWQDVTDLDLYGTVRGAISTLDVVNHIKSMEAVGKFFSRIELFMEEGGVFIFDMNLPYKHECVLSDNAFVFEFDNGMLVWQNQWEAKKKRTRMTLNLFLQGSKGIYSRNRSSFYEYAYTLEEIETSLQANRFEVLSIADGESFGKLSDTSQRAVITVKRK